MATAKKRVLEVMATNTNGEVINYSFNYDPESPVVTDKTAASSLSTLMGAVNGLTTNTYVDTYVSDTFSLNELKA